MPPNTILNIFYIIYKMNTLDIILINTISYMTGIFTGLVVSYKLRSNKNCNKNNNNNNNNTDNNEEKRM